MDRTYHAHEFACRAGVTVRALHHYDRLGLLPPSGRSAAGYRVYTDRDLVRLEQIVTLKFLGFSLQKIRELLDCEDSDLACALQRQRMIISEKREYLDRAVKAIERAEKVVAAGQDPQDALRKIIEVIQMQNRKDWMKKYYTPEQLADLSRRWSPEIQEQSQRDWAQLAQDTEAAIARGETPESETGRQIAARRRQLLEQFTGGNAGIAASLQKLYADKANWPADFKQPFSEAVNSFLCEAAQIHLKSAI